MAVVVVGDGDGDGDGGGGGGGGADSEKGLNYRLVKWHNDTRIAFGRSDRWNSSIPFSLLLKIPEEKKGRNTRTNTCIQIFAYSSSLY